MSAFHYVRTEGANGGVDTAEGRAIGLDLASVVADGLPPLNVTVQILASLAEILAIMEEDAVVHGDLQLEDVLIDDTGAVSLEGFGRPSSSPGEGPYADRYGLGRVAYELLAGQPLRLPQQADTHEDAAIDAILELDLGAIPDGPRGELQWILARLLAWEPAERPPPSDAWRTFNRILPELVGPDFARWCSLALEGRGQRRDPTADPIGASWDLEVSRTDGPIPGGGIHFDPRRARGPSTQAWTRDGMKEALQRAMASDYLEDPDTDWMPGTPLPSLDRAEGPTAPGDFRASPQRVSAQNRDAGSPVGSLAGTVTRSPRVLEDEGKTEVGDLRVPTGRPAPPRPKRTAPAAPPVPTPMSEALQRTAGPKADPDTAPQLIARPKLENSAQPPAGPIEPARAEEAPPPPPPLPDAVQIPTGPDPFASIEDGGDGRAYVMLGAVGAFLLAATLFCLGVGGVGGLAAFGIANQKGPLLADGSAPRPSPPPSTRPRAPSPRSTPPAAPTPKPARPKPVRRAQPRPQTRPRSSGRSSQPVPPSFATPAATPATPPPAPRFTPGSGAAVPPSPKPGFTGPGVVPPTPKPSFSVDTPPASLYTEPPPLPLDVPDDGSIVNQLVPTSQADPSRSPSELQMTMIAHFNAATAARDAVIDGDAQGAREAVRMIGLIKDPASLPPNWAPYLADMKMEAWLMENSPSIPAAAFKVAQLGQSCATCHAGVRAGPTVHTDAIPPREFRDEDVMKQHAWAADWLWVGLLANDQEAWDRGARELDGAPFPSVALTDFPDDRFMELEDTLHRYAKEARQARTVEARGFAYGKILSTCSRCHDVYREITRNR